MAPPSRNDHRKSPIDELIARCENAQAIDHELIRKAKVESDRNRIKIGAKKAIEGKRPGPGRPRSTDPKVRVEAYVKTSTRNLWSEASEKMGFDSLSQFIEHAVSGFYSQWVNAPQRHVYEPKKNS